jgi:hypothetical protein
LDKIKALKILTLNNYIQLPRNEKLQKIRADEFRKSLIDCINWYKGDKTKIDLYAVETNLLMLVSDYFVSDWSMKKKLLRIRQKVRDKYKKYNLLKIQILNEPGILVEGGEKSIKLENENEFKAHELNVTAGTANFSFHIILFLCVKKIHELTKYSIVNICTLISHTFEYFNLLPATTTVPNYAYSLKNKFYRLRNH